MLAGRLLRTHVVRCSDDHALRGELADRRGLCRFRDSEVGHEHVPPAVEQDVVGLHVAVDDSVLVSVAERIGDLSRDAGRVANREAMLLLEQMSERRAVDAAHHDVQHLVLVAPDLVDRDDVRMLELCAGARLAYEPVGERGRWGLAQIQHFHRDVTAGVLFPDAEHGCEPALAEQVPHSKFGSEGFLETLAQRVEVERHGGRET